MRTKTTVTAGVKDLLNLIEKSRFNEKQLRLFYGFIFSETPNENKAPLAQGLGISVETAENCVREFEAEGNTEKEK